MQSKFANGLVVLFCVLLTAGVLYLYFGDSPRALVDIPTRIENKLFDIRTRLSPSVINDDSVAVVRITEDSIAAIDGPEAADLSIDGLIKVLTAIDGVQPKLIIPLLPQQVFNYRDKNFERLTEFVAARKNIILGTFDIHKLDRQSHKLPLTMDLVRDRLYAATDLTRDYRRNVVREMSITNPDGLPMLATHFMQADRKVPGERFKINYFNPAILKTLNAETVLLPGPRADLQGKIVLVGYSAFRKKTFQFRESTHVNSPWQSDGDDVEQGMPMLLVQAVAITNMIDDSWLRPAPHWLGVVQTVLITLICLFVWRLSVGFASFFIIGFWCCILLVHAGLFSFANYHVPLADSVLFSVIASIMGAMWKLRAEGHKRAIFEAETRAEREIAQTQDRFLNHFATEMSEINANVRIALSKVKVDESVSDTIRLAYTKALGSCEELGDYLQGIEQFANINSQHLGKVTLDTTPIKELVEKVLVQFESRKSEKRLEIVIEGEECEGYSDKTLLSQIVFNLISNAIKYTPEEGKITIVLTETSTTVLLKVNDQGPGVPEKFQERIFEKFYRIKDDYVYKLKGHGLGLYLSRYFSEQIGTVINVANLPNGGASFSLDIPKGRGP